MSVERLYRQMRDALRDVIPDFELRIKAELAHEILRLKRERNAVILAHNYMEPALYFSVADLRGDSLELCRQVAKVSQDVVVFCGVRFMAETAKVLCPDKTVLLPAEEAGCSLAAGITADDVRGLKARFPGAPVVAYVNTYAEVKAEADVCCTSGNAATVVESFGADTVILVPDEFLARNVARETGRRIVIADGTNGDTSHDDQRRLVGWRSRCEVHEQFTTEDVHAVRQQFPDAVILAHPECSPEVVEASDFAASTAGMIRHVERCDASRYLLLTECTMGDNVAAAHPDKEMLRLCSVRCPHMNEITLEQTRDALARLQYEVEVPEVSRAGAARSIQRMLAVA